MRTGIGEDVLAVAARMQAEGCRVWYDEGISPGTERAEHIAERLTGCDYFIAFLSPEYLESANCLDELSLPGQREKTTAGVSVQCDSAGRHQHEI